ncbi:toll-like receptor 6 isoform X1 [Pleurodeles waltl]|uniref:toll-like receptor 6 isoform X1 n=1 Tax=Pleurodeles waltl TaxID=8319 RepID=UPI00370975AF
MTGILLRSFVLFSTFVFSMSNTLHLPPNTDYIANFSHSSLLNVPKNLPLQTTILDLQANNISILVMSDFSYLSKLKVLNMSNNKLNELDCSIFTLNKEMVYLDLSHNRLDIIYGQFKEGFQYLDLSFNHFKSLSMCEGFKNMIHLKYLGLGAAVVQKSDLEGLQSLRLHTVLLELESLSHYEPGSLQMLNTLKLRLVLPKKDMDPYSLLTDAVNSAQTLELSNINYATTLIDAESLKHSRVSDITMINMTLSWSNIVKLLQAFWKSSVKFLKMEQITIVGAIEHEYFDYSATLIQEMMFENVTITDYRFSQDVVYRFVSEMNILRLTVNHANIIYMLCPSKPSIFRSLNFAHNALTDDIYQDCSNLANLESLILPWNKLKKLSSVSSMTTHMISLQHLDVSHNSLQYETDEYCHWSESIINLDLSENELTDSVFICLPITVKKLDLHSNQIDHISLEIRQFAALEELNLASNRLKDLPDCRPFGNLVVINVAMNSIQTPSPQSLYSCPTVKTIQAEHNPFQCNCDLREFVYREKQSSARLSKWPESYRCAYPETLKGTFLQDFRISELSCNRSLLIVLIFITVTILTLCLFCLCKYLDIPWYMRMIWQWTQTRRRTKNSRNAQHNLQQNFDFHAFVSYSEHDSPWVKECLLPNLEREDGSIQICQHERNFVAGKSIVENIINCIDRSFKSIFVLSPNFIQSEWCHYELYFAQHKVFTENSDDLILILLEPIPKYLIPARYHKLKALMARRTYLEWPKEKGKQRLFWANLRAAITINLAESDEELIT